MVPIRSWSGGRLFDEADQLEFFSPNSDSDDHISVSNHLNDELKTDLTSSAESYDDDFTDDESFYERIETTSMNDENTYLCQSISDNFRGEEQRHTDSENQFEDLSESSCSYSVPSSDHSSFEIFESNDDCNENLAPVNQSGAIKDINTNSERQAFFQANVRHKKWLEGVQNAAKIKREMDKEKFLRLKKIEVKRRNILVLKARHRKKVGYDCVTEAAKHGRVKIEKNDRNKLCDIVINDEQRKLDRERRRRSKMKYREHLDNIVKRREMEGIEEENARIEAAKIRKKITTMVLNGMRKNKEASKNIQNSTNEEEKINDKNTNQMGNEEAQQEYSLGCDDLKIREFNKRYMSEFNSIVLDRQKKEKEAERLKRRLQRRAAILRQQYKQSNDHPQPWKRSGTENIVLEQSGNISKANERNVHQQEQADAKVPSDNKMLAKDTLLPSKLKTFDDRLSRRKQVKHAIKTKQNGSSFDKWKCQNDLGLDQKVFCITGWYPTIREELLRRGWFLNKDKDSTYFDLKFTLAVSDIDFSTLTEKQMVNHFKSSRCLTTKVGLLHTLRNCPFFANHHYDVNDFFPRSYDFSFPIDLQNFLDDYYCLEAKAILKRLLHRWQRNKTIKINVGVLKTLINVIRKCSYKVDDSFLDSSGLIEEQCFSSLQSIIIQHGDDWLHREVYDTDLNEDSCQAKTIKSLLVDRKKIEDVKATAKKRTKLLKLLCQLHLMDENYMDLIKVTLEKHCDTSSLQSTINGANSNNIWILKPAGKSRGRGISVEKSLHGILKHIAAASDSRNKLNQWVVQKYIENPMTIAKRKFDIRQWVMVTDWNPVTIWFYNECYIRFAVLEYDDPQNTDSTGSQLENEWASNRYRHLVNNSIGKKSEKYSTSFVVEEIDDTVNGCMWSLDKFKQWLLQKTGKNEWEDSMSVKIKEIVIDSILCAQEGVTTDKNKCWEVYGFDIMIDENYHPWLIEINSSPACDYSTPVTEAFVKKALPDILKVVLDNGYDNQQCPIDTGGWDRIYRGERIPKVAVGIGIDLPLKGEKLVKRYKKKAKRKSNQHHSNKTKDELIFDDSDLSDYEQKKKSQSSSLNQSHQEKKDLDKENSPITKNINSFTDTKFVNKRTKNHVPKIAVPLNKVTLGL